MYIQLITGESINRVRDLGDSTPLYPVVAQARVATSCTTRGSVTHGVLNNIAESVTITTATNNRSEPSELVVRRVADPSLRSMHGYSQA